MAEFCPRHSAAGPQSHLVVQQGLAVSGLPGQQWGCGLEARAGPPLGSLPTLHPDCRAARGVRFKAKSTGLLTTTGLSFVRLPYACVSGRLHSNKNPSVHKEQPLRSISSCVGLRRFLNPTDGEWCGVPHLPEALSP